eukprot:CAMPEP_0201593106 /NCGR_PEP_ID=MMETSP0190_2-20130828/190824_1 /ASSEMBLY_ACC=CAM_ASM_000263 /TAXON_ID=37353 /ORGANISM="Rosalina sp." /LENGTH=166 /DNA_ID=CAMNT_0048052191 /DNA_START=117 /DNA_END=618 /DNA_ORIENTATION=+
MNNLVIALALLLSLTYTLVEGGCQFEIWIDEIENDSGFKAKEIYAEINCYGNNGAHDSSTTGDHDIEDGKTYDFDGKDGESYDFDFHHDTSSIWSNDVYEYCELQLLTDDSTFGSDTKLGDAVEIVRLVDNDQECGEEVEEEIGVDDNDFTIYYRYKKYEGTCDDI